ncbi:MAG: hypothetical protein ACYC6A_02065 [Armatimonadota bacterium]
MQIVVGGGWAISGSGAVFLLPGLALLLIGFHVIPIAGQDFMVNGVPVLGLFGLPFFLVGGSLICWRRWLTFDLGRRTLVIQSGLLMPIIRKARALQDFTSVGIFLQINSSSTGDGPTRTVKYYSVQLTASALRQSLIINNYNCNAYGAAYALAARLAAFLGIPVMDMSSEHPLEIVPADLACPLRARLRSDDAVVQHTAPATLRSQVEESSSGVRVSIPGQTPNRQLYLLVLLITAVPAAIFFFFLQGVAGADSEIRYLLLGGIVLIIGFSLLPILRKGLIARRSFTVVSVDRQHLSIEEHRGKRITRTVMLPVADILDIDYSLVQDRRQPATRGDVLREAFGSDGISLKTQTGLYTFGAGLPDAEVEYLVSIIEKALAATLIQTEQC